MRLPAHHIGVQIAIALLIAISAITLQAQTDVNRDGVDHDSATMTLLVSQLCEATSTAEQIENGLPSFIWPYMEDSITRIWASRVKEHFGCDDVAEGVAPQFWKVLTLNELQEIVAFFQCSDVRRYYKEIAAEGEQYRLLGLDMWDQAAAQWKKCRTKAASPGMKKWFDIQSRLDSNVYRLVDSLFASTIYTEFQEIKKEFPAWTPTLFSPAVVAEEIAKIPPKKLEHIVSCLKGAGFRDMMVTLALGDVHPESDGYDSAATTEAEDNIRRFYTILNERIEEDSLIDIIAPVFDKYFTDKEMKLLAAFYQTVAGKAYVQIKLKQLRNPAKLTAIFVEEFDKLSAKEQERMISFRDTEEARKFIDQSPALSAEIFQRFNFYLKSMMRESRIDLIEDVDLEQEPKSVE